MVPRSTSAARPSPGAWTFKYNGSWSAAKEREAGSLDPVEFSSEFDGDDELDVSFDYGDWRLPRFTLSGSNLRRTAIPRHEFAVRQDRARVA